MATTANAVSTKTTPAAKKGQASKVLAPVMPTAPKGYTTAANHHSPAKQVKLGLQQAGYSAATGYPQGAQLVAVVPQPVGLTAQAQSYHKALCAALGGMGVKHAAPCNVLVAALQGQHAHAPRRVLRRAVRAGLIVWQATS